MSISKRILELYDYIPVGAILTCIKSHQMLLTNNMVTNAYTVNVGDRAYVLRLTDKLVINIDKVPERSFSIPRDSVRDLVTTNPYLDPSGVYWTLGDYSPSDCSCNL